MATHSSILAWRILWTEEPGGLKSKGSQRVGHESIFTFTFHFHALEKEMATHSSVLALKNPKDRGAWWASISGVAQSRTRLKRLSSSSSKQSEMKVAQLCPTLCDPMDYSPLGSSVHGILQARILEWVTISFSRGSS